MIIQSIQIENFRQFKGQQPLINFSTDSDRNVTVLLGDNTSGKTTFLQAFNWCLYGFANFKSSKDLLNKEVEQEVLDNKQYKAIMSVTLTLMHHEYEYTVQRSQAYVKRGEEVKPLGEESVDISRKGADGTTEQLQYPKKRTVINSIFPQELSTYFLYDTERFKNITENADLKTAVEDLLGLTAYENAIEHIGPINSTSTQKVLGMLRNSLESEDEKNSHQLQAQIEKIDRNIENIKKEQIQLDEDITYYAEKAKEKRGELMKFANAKEKELDRQEAEKTLDIYRYSLKKKREKIRNDISARPQNYFAQPLIHQALEILEGAQLEDVGIRDMNANSINHIIERGHCVCGTPIEKETPEYESLLREKEYLPPQSIGLMIRQFTQSLNSMKNNGERYVEHVTHTHEDILNLDVQIGETEEHLKVLSEELKGIDSVHALEVEVQKYEGFERECLQKKGANKNQIEALEKRKTSLTTKLSNLAANTKTNRKIQEKIKYVEGVRQWFEDSYNRQSFELREDLEKRVNHYFQEMYHGNRVVEIDDRYRVTLKVKNDIRQDTEIDGSQGLETVKNFAFLAGLADLAEHKKLQDKKNDEGITAVESLPMILDAPFSNTDDTHVSNISRVLPQVSEQLILIVMQKDFTHAETVMSKHIGKKYRFVKKSETHTEIEEVSL